MKTVKKNKRSKIQEKMKEIIWISIKKDMILLHIQCIVLILTRVFSSILLMLMLLSSMENNSLMNRMWMKNIWEFSFVFITGFTLLTLTIIFIGPKFINPTMKNLKEKYKMYQSKYFLKLHSN
jgi:hypothetical protein